MNTTMLKLGRRLWCVGHADRATQRYNLRAWAKSLRQLGGSWVMAANQPRLREPMPEGKMSSMVMPFPLRTPRSLLEAYESRRQA